MREELVESIIVVAIILIPFSKEIAYFAVYITTLPLSLLLIFIAINCLEQGFNTMTLGGLSIAINSLLYDVIVDAKYL
ncbi:efflux RND transporter permease subunit [Trichormus azollae]|uniref:efflux RND transporter permease subunit n=1 Tax=Trichormus azollae TaxID=1164 RepID=UPI00325DE11C